MEKFKNAVGTLFKLMYLVMFVVMVGSAGTLLFNIVTGKIAMAIISFLLLLISMGLVAFLGTII